MMNLVMRENFVMYESITSVRASEEFQSCKVSTIGFSMSRIEYAFALPKRSPLRKAFNRALSRMAESGELPRITRGKTGEKQACDEERRKGRPIGINNLIFPIGIYMAGAAMAFTVFLLELWTPGFFCFGTFITIILGAILTYHLNEV